MTGSYNDVSGLFSWNVSYSGLSGTPTAAHFHGPALPNQSAGVQVGIGLANPNIGSTTISAAQGNQLLDDLWYINIHSTVNGGGEIRGQVLVVPEPSRALLGLIGFLPVALRRRRA